MHEAIKEVIMICGYGIFIFIPWAIGVSIILMMIAYGYLKWLWKGVIKTCPWCGEKREVTIHDSEYKGGRLC